MLLSTRTCCCCSIVAPVSTPQPFPVRMTWISVSRVVLFSDLVHFDLSSLKSAYKRRGVWQIKAGKNTKGDGRWQVEGRLKSCLPTALTYARYETLWTSELSLATGFTWIIFPCWNWDPFGTILQCTVQWTPVDSITWAYLAWQNIGYIIYCYKYYGGRSRMRNTERF